MSDVQKEDFSPQKVMETVNAMHEILKKKDADSAENKEKLSRIDEYLEKQEEINQKRLAEIKQKEKDEIELKERLTNIEKSMSRIARSGTKDSEKIEHRKAFEQLVKKGADLDEVHTKYYRTDVNPNGGYLCPPDYVAEILKQIVEISPLRPVCRVRKTSSTSVELPKRTGTPQATWEGEGANTPETAATYGKLIIKVNKIKAKVIITEESLSDSAFDMDSEISSDITEQFSYTENLGFLTGNSVNKPEGILFNADVQAVISGDASDLTSDSLIDITGQLKTGYNPLYMFNRRTLARIRKFKGSDGQFIWTPTLAEGSPNMINGEPYIIANDMPDIAAGAYPVLYGDFMRAYTIVDGVAMNMIRDIYTLSEDGKVQFIFTRRTGGQVVMAEAMKKLIISA